jgi:hypothetical protein
VVSRLPLTASKRLDPLRHGALGANGARRSIAPRLPGGVFRRHTRGPFDRARLPTPSVGRGAYDFDERQQQGYGDQPDQTTHERVHSGNSRGPV